IYAGDARLQTPNIDNSGGQLSVSELAVSGPRFSNAGGTLNVANGFSAQVDRFDNAGGQLNAGQLVVKTGELDNRGGTLRSNNGDAALEASGDVLNTQGTLSSTGALTVTAGGQLENTGGQVLTSQTLQVRAGSLVNTGNLRGEQGTDVAVRDALLNQGSITSGGDTRIRAATVQSTKTATLGAGIGADGSLGPQGNLNVQATQALQANGQQLAAEVVTLRGASVDLSGGATSGAQVSVTADSGDIVTSGGRIVSNGEVSIGAARLDNTGGQVVGASLDIDTRGGALVNTDGALAATKRGVDIRSGALNNDGGVIQSAGDLRIDTHGQALSNRNTHRGTSDQDKGIASAGALSITSGALDNSAGLIAAEGDLTAHTGAVSNTGGGLIASNANLAVDTQGSGYDNQGGRTQAKGDLRIDARRIDNSGASLIRSGGTATLASAQLVNRDTQGQDQGIEATDLAIQTTELLDNTRGAIRASQDARITSAGHVDNTAGLISAKRDLEVLDPLANVAGGDVRAKTLAITNTGGTLVADQDLRIDAAALTGDGTTTAERDVGIALTQDVVNNVDVSAGRNLSYATTGQFTNNAKLRAGQTLAVRGDKGVDNNAGGELSGTDTVVQTAGALNNRGLIDSTSHTQIDAAGGLDNSGGRIYGDRISIAAGSLNNSLDTASGKAGSIATRTGDIDLGVAGELTNADGGEIFSGAGLYVGGALDEDRLATGRAQKITNLASTIESVGEMKLGAQQLDNLNKGFSTKEETTTEAVNEVHIALRGSEVRYGQDELGQCFQCQDDQKDWGAEGLTRREWVAPSQRYPFEAGYARHPYALPSASSQYGNDDPVWKLFSVSPGDVGALTAALRAYNADFMSRARRDFVVYTTTERQTTQTVVDNAGTAG
ncbi:MAG: hypothetical protein JSS56_26715, partial [Proteobacteria bacterium]|nr:hypothetical protein [Pseudomonadota bacterium]